MGYDFPSLLNTVLGLFIMLIVGYIARRIKFIDDVMSKKLSSLVLCIAQPFLMLSAILSTGYSPEKLKSGFFVLILAAGIYALCGAVGFISFLKVKDKSERILCEYGAVFANSGFMGFPILKAVLPENGLFLGAFFVIMFNISFWTYGMLILRRANPQLGISVKSMVFNYGTVPAIVGLALYLLRIKIPGAVITAIDGIGSICTPVSMLVIGGLLATLPVKKIFLNLKIYYFSFIRLIFLPLAVALLCRLFSLSAEMTFFAAVVTAMPTAAASSMMAQRFDIKPDFAALTVGMSTFLSVGTIPLVLYLTELITNI